MNADRLEEYISLTKLKHDLEHELDAAKADIATLETQLLEDFAELGVSSVRSVGGATLYLHRQLWANAAPGVDGDGDYPRACEALRLAGLGDLVQPRFNANSLSALVREWARNDEPMPAAFEGREESQLIASGGVAIPAIRVSEKVGVRVRGAS